MSSHIRNYHTRVAYNSEAGQDIYELSGEELTQWTGDFAATTADGLIHPFTGYSGVGCSEIIYFWQEDPSNYEHDFHLSDTLDGHHDAGGGYTLSNYEGYSESGVPGTSGACARFDLEQFTTFQMDPSSIAFSWVYPFCWYDPGMGNTGNVFECDPILTECPVGCNLSSAMSGELALVSGEAGDALDLIYGSHSVLSSSYTTGVETGQFPLCSVIGSGDTQTNALLRTVDLLSLFATSGLCTNDSLGGRVEAINVSNISLSYSNNNNFSVDGIYFSEVTGFSDRIHYVIYNPTISGNKTVVNVNTYCPDTELQVTIDRERTIHTLSTFIAILSGAIHNVDVTLPVVCSGYTTALTASCPKIKDGMELYGEKTFTQGNELCWSEYFETGVYKLEHIHGPFLATDEKYTLGSGTLTAKAYV